MMGQDNGKYYQVSTLQALALGFSKSVITVEELIRHGNLGLGTFEDVDGEMIVLDGKCYRATNNGDVVPAEVPLVQNELPPVSSHPGRLSSIVHSQLAV